MYRKHIAYALKRLSSGRRSKRSEGTCGSATQPSTSGAISNRTSVLPSCAGCGQLEEKNRKLKQVVADPSLDKAMLQAVVA